ncbi:uncharacterized, partial [Tachysurus ichikawai]
KRLNNRQLLIKSHSNYDAHESPGLVSLGLLCSVFRGLDLGKSGYSGIKTFSSGVESGKTVQGVIRQ